MTTLACNCKINLGLYIKGIRADGYHDIESIFIPISRPHDRLTIKNVPYPGLSLACNVPGLADRGNLLFKAYAAFQARTGFTAGLDVYLEKGIPVGAGLGGGSSDAAFFLKWLNGQAGAPLDTEGLRTLAASIGADVPFFLLNRTSAIGGTGDVIRPLDCSFACHVILVWPGVAISTAWAFRRFDEKSAALPAQYRANGLTKLTTKDKQVFSCGAAAFEGINNQFEPVIFESYPQLAELKRRILGLGAAYASMSGSGSAFYGLFNNENAAMRARAVLKSSYSHVFYSRPCDTGV